MKNLHLKQIFYALARSENSRITQLKFIFEVKILLFNISYSVMIIVSILRIKIDVTDRRIFFYNDRELQSNEKPL
jgi:hypothetical protein